ncbi:unnamed protein product, partial [Ectocarpus sp. 12 AP-2014]
QVHASAGPQGPFSNSIRLGKRRRSDEGGSRCFKTTQKIIGPEGTAEPPLLRPLRLVSCFALGGLTQHRLQRPQRAILTLAPVLKVKFFTFSLFESEFHNIPRSQGNG